MKREYKRMPEKLSNKKVTVPNRALTVQDILKRFVRRQEIPQLDSVYLDQPDGIENDPIDYEKLSRGDFHEKSETARGFGDYINDLKSQIRSSLKPKVSKTEGGSGETPGGSQRDAKQPSNEGKGGTTAP